MIDRVPFIVPQIRKSFKYLRFYYIINTQGIQAFGLNLKSSLQQKSGESPLMVARLSKFYLYLNNANSEAVFEQFPIVQKRTVSSNWIFPLIQPCCFITFYISIEK